MNEKGLYEQINKINDSLDELNREIDEENGVITKEEPVTLENEIFVQTDEVANEISDIPEIESNGIEENNDLVNEKNSDFELTREIISNDVAMPTVTEEEITKDLSENTKGHSGKGQIILIIILSVVLVGLLASMIYFVNTL